MRVYIAKDDAIQGVWYNLDDAREAMVRWGYTLVHENDPKDRHYMAEWSRSGLNGGPGDIEIMLVDSHEVTGFPAGLEVK